MDEVGWLERVLGIRPEERRTTLLFFGYSLCLVGAAFIVGRTLGTTLFLSRVDPELIPYTYVLSAVGVSVASTLYARFADALRRDRMVAVTATLFAALSVLGRVLVARSHASLATMAGVYVFFDIVGDISMIQFWTLASEVFDARQAKRLFSFIASGGAVAGMVLGALLGGAVRVLGTENLFFVVAALLLGCAALATAIGPGEEQPREQRKTRRRRRRPEKTQGLGADLSRMLSDSYVRSLALLIAVTTIATILVDYQWKVAARAAYLGDEAGLAAYFGLFSLATSGLALFFQVFLAARLIERFGVRASLMLLPGTLLVASVGMLLVSGARAMMWAATAAKGADGAFRYSIHEATTQVLYRPLASAFRSRTKAVIDGIVKPLCAASGGLLIAAATGAVGPTVLKALTVPTVGLWLLLIAFTARQYVRSLGRSLDLAQALQAGRLTLDASARELLEGALRGRDAVRARNALAMLTEAPDEPLPAAVVDLAFHSDDDLAETALTLIAERGTGADVARLLPMLEEPSLTRRALGIAAIVRRGGLADLLSAARRLEGLLTGDPDSRVAAARALGGIGEARFQEPLLALLADECPRVRVAAARACVNAPAPETAPALLAMLARPAERAAAAEALEALGGDARDAIHGRVRGLLEPDERAELPAGPERSERRVELENLCRVAGRLADSATTELLVKVAETARDAFTALEELEGRELGPAECAALEGALDEALGERLRRAIDRSELGEIEPRLLGDALSIGEARLRRRILGLIAALYPVPGATLRAALEGDDATRRANAVELLDNVVPLRFRSRALLALGERDPARLAWSARAALPDYRGESRRLQLESFAHSDDPWLICCALYELGETVADDTLSRCLTHPSELVRETAERGRRLIERRTDA